MKTNRNSLIVLLALGSLLALGPAARAQDQANRPPARGQRGALMREHFKKVAQELNLTDEQKSKVQAVFQQERQKLQALRADTSLTPDQRRAKVKEIRDEIGTKMKGILTTEQYDKWMRIREEARQNWQERRQERQGNKNQTS